MTLASGLWLVNCDTMDPFYLMKCWVMRLSLCAALCLNKLFSVLGATVVSLPEMLILCAASVKIPG